MSKKGISPLIATVLIIGFTIVLAALVMQWGGGLFKSVQEQTGKTSEFKIVCSSRLSGLDINAKGADVTIDNKNDYDIAGFMIRRYSVDGSNPAVYTTITADVKNGVAQISGRMDVNGELPSYGVKTYKISDLAAGQTVGVFPMVKIEGENMICENEWKVVSA